MKNWSHRSKVVFVVLIGIIGFCAGLLLTIPAAPDLVLAVEGALIATMGITLPTIETVFDLGL